MGLTVNVTQLDGFAPVTAGTPTDKPDSEAPVEMVRCDVVDDDNGLFGPSFEYFVIHRGDGGVDLHLVGMRVGGPHGTSGFNATRTSVSEIRDMPLARWEQAARASLTMKYSGALPPAEERPQPALDWTQDDLNARVLELFPELRGDDTPAGRRRLKSLSRLARTANHYMELLAAGRSDPAAEMARRLNESPATVRSWIHRARKVGLLSPAVGRTAGVSAQENLERATAQAESRLEQLRTRLTDLEAQLAGRPPSTHEGLDSATRKLTAQAEDERATLWREIERMETALASARRDLAVLALDDDVQEFADTHARIEEDGRRGREARGDTP
ncbi:hypothetical protein ABGB07_43935 [Micromonosporaceae bacterium B7E4]